MLINFYHHVDNAEPERICYFKCTDYEEYVKLMLLCKEHQLELWPRDASEYVNKKFSEGCLGYTVSDVLVNFGGDDVLPTIDVLLE